MGKIGKSAAFLAAVITACVSFGSAAEATAQTSYTASMTYEEGVLKTDNAPSDALIYQASYDDNGVAQEVRKLEVKAEQEIEAKKGDRFFLWSGMLPLCVPVEVSETAREPKKDTIVVYFSFQGSTKKLAESIVSVTDADIWQIVPEEPYGNENLNYYDSSTRSYIEQNTPSMRPKFTGSLDSIADYDTVILGYPIWYGKAPRIILTFLGAYKDDLDGKTIIPFCTSGSSGISGSLSEIRSAASKSTVKDGFRGTASMTESNIKAQLGNNGYTVK